MLTKVSAVNLRGGLPVLFREVGDAGVRRAGFFGSCDGYVMIMIIIIRIELLCCCGGGYICATSI